MKDGERKEEQKEVYKKEEPPRDEPAREYFPQTLADLRPGEAGVVDTVGGEEALHRHLLDMGLTPGVTVLLQKTAPMGDPLELHLRGYSLTLRVEDARNILLRPASKK